VSGNIDRSAASWSPNSLRTTSALPVHARFPHDLAAAFGAPPVLHFFLSGIREMSLDNMTT
jgi:hypothetical protein